MTHTDDFTDRLELLIADETRFVAAGRAETFEEYRMRCGRIAGHRRALDEYRAFIDKQRHDDD